MAVRQGYSPTATVTRPNDTTAYTAGDVVGGAITLGQFGPRESTMMVLSSQLIVATTGVISGETSYRLHLYNATPPSALADNAAWDLADADLDSYQGYIDLGTVVDVGANLHVQTDAINHCVRMADEAGVMYGYLVTVGGYTPTANRVYRLTLHAVV